MWRGSRTQKQLAAILNVDQGSISNRLRGKTNWSAVDVSVVAQWLGVPVTDIMPEVELGSDPPEPGAAGYRVAGLPLPWVYSKHQPFGQRFRAWWLPSLAPVYKAA
jgi:transcriptional regulator with XRE-family HTH domain